MDVPRIPRFRLRTLLLTVIVVALVLGGLRWLQWRGHYVRNMTQVQAWTGQRNRFRELAQEAHSNGDLAAAAKWVERAVWAEGLRKLYAHFARGGSWQDAPPVPDNPDWPPTSGPAGP